MPGPQEILIIVLILVIFFGAARLPKLGKSLGQGLRNFKTGLKSAAEDDTEAEGPDKS